jgi:hypothetical protein
MNPIHSKNKKITLSENVWESDSLPNIISHCYFLIENSFQLIPKKISFYIDDNDYHYPLSTVFNDVHIIYINFSQFYTRVPVSFFNSSLS